jgi:hypothetical protein
MFLVVIVKKLANTKENTDEIFPLVRILPTKYSLVVSIGKHRQKYTLGIY